MRHNREPDASAQRIARWVSAASKNTTYSRIENPPGVLASIEGIRGAWGYGASREDAAEELRAVLAEWVALKLEYRDDDIPEMGGLALPGSAIR